MHKEVLIHRLRFEHRKKFHFIQHESAYFCPCPF